MASRNRQRRSASDCSSAIPSGPRWLNFFIRFTYSATGTGSFTRWVRRMARWRDS